MSHYRNPIACRLLRRQAARTSDFFYARLREAGQLLRACNAARRQALTSNFAPWLSRCPGADGVT